MQVDRTGNFRGVIIEYGLYKSDRSESVGVNVRARIEEIWNGEAWEDWSSYDMEASGSFYIIGKEGSVLTNSVNALCNLAGWDGTIDSIVDHTWNPPPIQFSVVEESNNGKTKLRIGFLNEYNRDPGGSISNATPDVIASIKNRFGGSLRAAAATARKIPPKTVPNGTRPQVPPPRLQPPVPPRPPMADPVNSTEDHDGTVPF